MKRLIVFSPFVLPVTALAKWLPNLNRQSAPGSASRILLCDAATGAVNWKRHDVGENDPIPA